MARANPANDGERLVALETQMCNVEQKVGELDTKMVEGFNALGAKLDAMVVTMDERYAVKLVEKVVWGGIALTLVAVLTALLALVVVTGQ